MKYKTLYSNSILISIMLLISQCSERIGEAAQYGMYEIVFESVSDDASFLFPKVSFYRPDGKVVHVDGFYDGESKYKARAYCNQKGVWKWEVHQDSYFKMKSGSFKVVDSKLKGKLKKHPEDPQQFAYENGEWFLHIGDTGYRYLSQNEPKWKEYIDQAIKVGMTKIRTWFNSSRFGVEGLFDNEHSKLNLSYWQEIDRRIAYAYENYPDVILQLIPFGEDKKELDRYDEGDLITLQMVQYAQARFSAFPNITWCISNDREIVKEGVELSGRRVSEKNINKIGKDMAKREPWGTLITNHQSRYSGYSFVDVDWSDVITLEDVDQIDGRLILEYRANASDPVVLDEDRYELYIKPEHPRYYFRRLMWASLLSGGHATYGGIHTFISHDEKNLPSVPVEEQHLLGVQGYFDVGLEGADDFLNINRFFSESGLTLVKMQPDDSLVGNIPQQLKCIRNDSTYIIYLANPDQIGRPTTQKEKFDDIRTANVSTDIPGVSIALPELQFTIKWFNPSTGEWSEPGTVNGGVSKINAPGPGDWVLLIQRS